MNSIKRSKTVSQLHRRTHHHSAAVNGVLSPGDGKLTLRFSLKIPRWVFKYWHTVRPSILARRVVQYAPLRRKRPVVARLGWGLMPALMMFTILIGVIELRGPSYELSAKAQTLLREPRDYLAQSLVLNQASGKYEYNKGYQPGVGVSGNIGSPKFTADFDLAPKEGATVTDPVSQVSVNFKPEFSLAEPKKDQNRLIYPLRGRDAQKVYTLQTIGFKEDIVLNSAQGDELEFKYKLELTNGTEARMESDGSLAIYGVDQMLLGNVSAAGEKDQELLEKARQNGKKTNLLFSFPAPFVKEYGKKKSDAKAWFELNGDELTIHASGLTDASYPLSVDPSVYVETAAKLMRGNNETNIDFDVENELIQKGSTTGARFDSLDATLSLPDERWGHGTAVAGGFVYVVGGNDGTSNQSSVYWAKFDAANFDINSPNPGDGVCTSWCTDSVYDLPADRAGLSLVAYNGYLYAIGGTDSTCSGTLNACSTVYVAKLGANGEPSLWHPTDTDKSNWDYWYTDTALNTERRYAAAVAYNNRMYLLGGQTNAASGGVTTVEYADIRPTGTLTTWTSTGMTALPSARFGHDAHIYNDYLYLVGGNSSGTLQNTVHYIKIQPDGTLVSSWSEANNFSTARMSWGGKFSAVWGAYLYVMGGCAAIDTEGECTSTGITDGGLIELASINADGSLAFWGSISNITHSRIGYGLVAWRNTIYSIGGCTAQDTSTGACTTTIGTAHYGIVNGNGDASTVGTSVDNTTAPCSDTTPSNCDLPGTTYIGNILSSTAIMNGFLYIIGGCTNNGCTTTSGNTVYTAINPDGSLSRPPSCPGGTAVDSYCVDSIDPISGGVAAAGAAIFGGRIYVVGGQDGSSLKGNIYHVAVNNDGSLEGAWTAQSFTNIAATSVSYTFAYARANPTSAGTYPGNLFIFGGCTATSGGAACNSSANTDAVYKCNIQVSGSLEEDDANDCDTTNQLQIGTLSGASGSGLALHAGTVYAGYIYLVGGVAPGLSDIDTVRYAKLDNSNNVVAVSGSAWIEAEDSSGDPIEMSISRRRGAAFGYNGYLYAIGGYDGTGSGTASDIQFAKINVGDGSIGLFETSVVTFNQRWGVSVPVSNSYAYIIGGCTSGSAPSSCTARTDVIQTFQIYNNDSGSPADFSSSGNLFPTDRFGASAAILNSYIYVAGGCVGVLDCDNATNAVEYALLNPDGTIGTWSSTTSLPADRVYGQLEAVSGTLYYMGGQDDSETVQSAIYYAAPSGSGTVSSWSTASGGIGDTSSTSAAARTQFGATVWNDRIYVLGGYDASLNSTSTVFVSPQLSSGGNISADSWTSSTAFNVARNGPTAIAYANNLYVLGGHDGFNFLSDVQYTQINSDGTIDSWNYTSSLPRNVSHADGFAANGYMYIFGGKQSAILCTSNTYVAPISANTTIDTGNNPTGLGEWFLTNERFSAERANLSAVYHEGKAYLMGGSCGTLEGGGGTVVLEDDFDPGLDAADWANTDRMSVGTGCGTLPSGNALVSTGNQGGTLAQAQTIDVDVGYGGTVSFYLRIPSSGGGSCDAPESGEDVELQYSTNSGSGWTALATYDEANFDTATQITETIPSIAWTDSTRFRWLIPNGSNGQDEFAIDSVVVTANDTPPLDELMFDDFDPTQDSSQWSSITNMTEDTNCGTLSSGNALVSQGGSSAQAITNNHDLLYGGVVSFYLRMSTDSGTDCRQPGNNQDLLLQYSHNNGSTWTTMATYDESAYNTPTLISSAIPAQAYSTTVRFRWIIPNANNDSVWAIDDVKVEAFDPILTYTGVHRAVSTTLLSQPQVAKYSRMIDTDTDVFPTKWLLNGVDNSVGARWTMRYRTMNDTDGVAADCGTADMSTWGQETNFGEVTLGQPEDYTPLDGSGTDIGCARFYYLLVEVDSSRAFGYPDDVTRGPTIADLSLFFTSDPSKRLRHGKTFTGGEQQPYDTPF